MILLDDLVSAATRFNKWSEVQACVQSDAAQAAMQVARRDFGGARYVPLDGSVFFESIVEDNDLMPIRYFELGRIAARAVGRICIDLGSGGQGYATGFLVAPGVLLTNWHVLKTAAMAAAATVAFDAEDDVRGFPKPSTVFELAPDTLFVSDEALDFAFVGVLPTAVDDRTPLAAFGYLRLFPQTGKITRDEYATVIQHPGGRQKQVAVRNNRIVVYVYDIETDAPDNHYLYYRTDTLAGSSGSPVLSDQFFVVALHRRGVPKTRLVDGQSVVLRKDGADAMPGDASNVVDYVANEGVRVSSILRRLASLATTDSKVAAAQVAVLAAAGTIRDGPFSVPVASFVSIGDGTRAVDVDTATAASAAIDADGLEIVRRSVAMFADAPGYDATWLDGHPIPLPAPTAALAKKLAPRIDRVAGPVLPFHHFSTAVHALRRMPVYAAVNIDGRSKSTLGAMPARPTWSYDPRISDEHQMDDTLFSQMLQRGHMAARDFVYWGADFAAADLHSFTLSNVCPQIAAFNGNKEWSKLERNIVTLAINGRQRVTVMMGPVLEADDPLYDDLRSARSTARKGSGIRLPRRFWYVVAWIGAGRLQVRPYLLDQADDLRAAGPLEIDLLAPERVAPTTIAAIERLTALRFAGLGSRS